MSDPNHRMRRSQSVPSALFSLYPKSAGKTHSKYSKTTDQVPPGGGPSALPLNPPITTVMASEGP